MILFIDYPTSGQPSNNIHENNRNGLSRSDLSICAYVTHTRTHTHIYLHIYKHLTVIIKDQEIISLRVGGWEGLEGGHRGLERVK